MKQLCTLYTVLAPDAAAQSQPAPDDGSLEPTKRGLSQVRWHSRVFRSTLPVNTSMTFGWSCA